MDQMVVSSIRKRVRISTEKLDEEIVGLIAACQKDLKIAGVCGSLEDPLYYQAVVLYCKAEFGFSDKHDQFAAAYKSLKDAMALSGEYAEATDGQI